MEFEKREAALSRALLSMTVEERIEALETSNAELRGVLILAGREIKKLKLRQKG